MQQCDSDPMNHLHLKNLHRFMHKLAGASGSFGFAELGVRAGVIEKSIHSLISSGGIEEKQGRDLLQSELRQFVQWIRAHVEKV